MIEQMLDYSKNHWLNIGSVIFLMVLIPVRGLIRARALEKIKKKFEEDEYVVYEPSFQFNIEYFAPFLFGGATLEFILNHELPTIHIIISILFTLFMLFVIFLSIYIKYIITNKKIYFISTMNFFTVNKLLKFIGINFFELSISNIHNVEIEKLPFGTVILTMIEGTQKKPIRLPLVENRDETKSKIRNLILELN